MNVVRVYRFENGAEVKIDNSLYKNISAAETEKRIKYAAETVRNVYLENKKKEKYEE